MSLIKNAITSAGLYALKNPLNMARMARHAIGFRMAVPLDALRWVVGQLPAGGAIPSDVRIEARPPAVHLSANANLMGTDVRASLSIRVDELRLNGEEARFNIRIQNIDIKAAKGTPLAQFIDSGAIDLNKPGSLIGFLPNKPPMLVEAKDDLFVLDLLKIPGLDENPTVRKLLRAVTPVLTLSAIRTENDLLIVALRPKLTGIPTLISEVRS